MPARPSPTVRGERPIIVAHRGLSGTRPENTGPAFLGAIEAGADGVETDIQRTSDNHLVLFHDANLKRTTDVEQVFPDRVNDPLGTFTLAELRTLDAGRWKDPDFAGTTVPTLEELLVILADCDVRLYAEFKAPNLYPGIEQQTIEVMRDHKMVVDNGGGRVKFESFDLSALQRVRELLAETEIGLASAHPPDDLSTVNWVDSINIDYRNVDAGLVAAAASHGLELTVWTVDDPQLISWYADLGVTTITTNRADVAVTTLGTRSS